MYFNFSSLVSLIIPVNYSVQLYSILMFPLPCMIYLHSFEAGGEALHMKGLGQEQKTIRAQTFMPGVFGE